MYTSSHQDGRYLVWKHVLCLKCYRMMNCNLEQYMHIRYEGRSYYAHIVCKPLKQPLPLLR
jgi:hypothetical protein